MLEQELVHKCLQAQQVLGQAHMLLLELQELLGSLLRGTLEQVLEKLELALELDSHLVLGILQEQVQASVLALEQELGQIHQLVELPCFCQLP